MKSVSKTSSTVRSEGSEGVEILPVLRNCAGEDRAVPDQAMETLAIRWGTVLATRNGFFNAAASHSCGLLEPQQTIGLSQPRGCNAAATSVLARITNLGSELSKSRKRFPNSGFLGNRMR